ncbi:MAG: DUF1631 domain-containing protein, partial [Gammaproteobacteria bacterium]|nr:DUF1631 domain-containing protein [Gammaproteobacteria bacterium]
MQNAVDPRNMLSAMYFQANGELLRLMDGFYSNIEDGLFELAYGHNNQAQQRHVVELMRELRFRREHLLNTFSKRMQRSAKLWIDQDDSAPEYLEEREIADAMATKCGGHFSPLLQTVSERIGHAIGRDVDRQHLPIS